MGINAINTTPNGFDINRGSTTNDNRANKEAAVDKPKTEETEQTSRPVNEKKLKEAIDKANIALFGPGRHFQFKVHKQTNTTIVKIIDDKTGETIKEIPPEKILDMVASIWEVAGIIIDKRA